MSPNRRQLQRRDVPLVVLIPRDAKRERVRLIYVRPHRIGVALPDHDRLVLSWRARPARVKRPPRLDGQPLVILIVAAVSGGPVLGVIIFLGVYRVFQDYVLSPQLMRAGGELHPLFVLFGVFAGAEIAGIPGAFLSVPVLAIVRIFYRRIRQVRILTRPSAVKPVLTP